MYELELEPHRRICINWKMKAFRTFQEQIRWNAPNIQNSNFSESESGWVVL